MVKEKDNKYGEVVAPNISLDRANKIRSYIKKNTAGYWVFVVKNQKTGKYNVSVQNAWGQALNAEETAEVRSTVKAAKEDLKEASGS